MRMRPRKGCPSEPARRRDSAPFDGRDPQPPEFSETDVLALGEVLGLPLLEPEKAAEVARSLSRIAWEYLIDYAIEHERSSAKQTAAWSEQLGRALGELRPFLALIAANPMDAQHALMLDPDEPDDHLAVLSSPAVINAAAAIERHAIEKARSSASQPKQDKVYNRKKRENVALMMRLVETFASAFGAPRPAPNAHAANPVFQAAGKFVEWLAAELKAKGRPGAGPPSQARHRRPRCRTPEAIQARGDGQPVEAPFEIKSVSNGSLCDVSVSCKLRGQLRRSHVQQKHRPAR